MSTSPAKTLQLHRVRKQYRGFSGTTYKDLHVEFLFSVASPGGPPTTFWTEVQLRRDLLERAGWTILSRDDLYRAAYCLAVEAIQRAGGRPVRQVSVGWKPSLPYAQAPSWELADVDLKRPAPVAIEGEGIQPVVFAQH
jgi:hypothetical protein